MACERARERSLPLAVRKVGCAPPGEPRAGRSAGARSPYFTWRVYEATLFDVLAPGFCNFTRT